MNDSIGPLQKVNPFMNREYRNTVTVVVYCTGVRVLFHKTKYFIFSSVICAAILSTSGMFVLFCILQDVLNVADIL